MKAPVALLWGCAVALAACSGNGERTPESLSAYGRSTSSGAACDAAISAVSYADDLLRSLGQEPAQDFDPAVRSRLSAVAGTLLNSNPWPTEDVGEQAEVVQRLARASAQLVDRRLDANGHDPGSAAAVRSGAALARVRDLTQYRAEAARLVLLCRDAAGDVPPG